MEVVAGEDDAGPNTTKRGVKRLANDSNFDDDQRFTKRFHLLNLGQHSQQPFSSSSDASHGVSASPSSRRSSIYLPVPAAVNDQPEQNHHQLMDVDDTRDRVYIGDLDAEVADIDAHQPEERLIFLPDIEKHFSRIPQQVLSGQAQDPKLARPEDQQLVLYTLPHSLTVDQSHDSVRRAIVDARHRARDRAKELARQEDMSRQYASTPADVHHAVEIAHGYGAGYSLASDPESDADAMDMS